MKLTEVHSLTMQIKTDIEKFKEGYEQVLIDLSAELKMPIVIKPAQVILDMVAGHCTMYVLRNPSVPAYKMNDYIFRLAQELKVTYGLSTVVLKRQNMYVDPNNVPEVLAVDPKEAAEIVKKAQEDELFSDKYKEYAVRRKTQKELDAEADAKACAYAEKLSAAVKEKLTDTTVPNTTPITNDTVEEEPETPIEIQKITFSIEKNGQLCLVF